MISVAVIFALTFWCGIAASQPTASLTSGAVLKGLELDEANAFCSIPYGQPPIGDLRFMDPVPYDSYEDMDVSNITGVGCIGIPVMCTIGQCATYESEDCLYLNVFVPKSVDLSADHPPSARKVIVWFHGGAFWFGAGTAPLYDGRFLANVTDTIIVSANYRLLPFGWLAMAGAGAPQGNMGFRDQQLVLQWVQDHIAAFGGDKSTVTIFGESAGAQSVALHLMNDASAPLFDKAIMDSNPVSFQFKTLEEAEEMGTILARRSGCLSGTWNCLKTASTQDIVKGFFMVMVGNAAFRSDFYGSQEPFAPIIDGKTFNKQIIHAFEDGNWQTDKSFIIGTNSEELYLVSSMMPPMSYETFVLQNKIIFTNISDDVTALYAPDPTLPDYRNAYGDDLTHFAFTCSSRALARAADANKVADSSIYYYRNYHPLGPPDCGDLLGPMKPICGTCYHSSELSFAWRTGSLINQTYAEDEESYTNAWSSYIGNFAISGNPNTGVHSELQSYLGDFDEWPLYTPGVNGDDWMNIALDAPMPYSEYDVISGYCDFWDTVGYDYPIMWVPDDALMYNMYLRNTYDKWINI